VIQATAHDRIDSFDYDDFFDWMTLSLCRFKIIGSFPGTNSTWRYGSSSNDDSSFRLSIVATSFLLLVVISLLILRFFVPPVAFHLLIHLVALRRPNLPSVQVFFRQFSV
jgi:hypothetical protein